MKKFEIEVKEELVNYIERLQFEINAKERIVKSMLGDTSYSDLMNNENFLNYQKKYELAFSEYEMAKQEIENTIPKHIRDTHQVSWSLDFKTNIMEITFNCNCFDDVEDIQDIFE